MTTVVQRRIELKPGKKNAFLELLKTYVPHLQEDQDVETFSIYTPQTDEDIVMFHFVLSDGADWDQRIKKEYVQTFLANTQHQDLVAFMETTHFDAHF